MDFFFTVLILVVYYVRPQDWVPGLAGANLIQPIALLAVGAVIMRRGAPRLGTLLRNPIDLVMTVYGAYIILTAPDTVGTFFGVLPFMIFYFVTRLSIDTPERLYTYLKWWLAMLVTIAVFGVGSLYGIDVTGAKEMTASFNGRLSLGTWIHNNPNSLGHTVILAIPLVYLALFWRSGVGKKMVAIGLILLAGHCVYETASRGSFVAGLVISTFGLTLGRPKFVQVLIAIFVLSSASAILSTLPRMAQVDSLKADEGVQGRMMAWEIARTAATNNANGSGWKRFEAYIEYEGETFRKATHSCYVRVAADLGLSGLFLYLAVLWACARSLIGLAGVGAKDERAERCRRMLFVLLAGYLVSGWMIDRSYQTEYFLLAAAVSAMFRIYRVDASELATSSLGAQIQELTPSNRAHPVEITPESGSEEGDPASKSWRKFGFVDIAISFVLVQLTLSLWDYILELF